MTGVSIVNETVVNAIPAKSSFKFFWYHEHHYLSICIHMRRPANPEKFEITPELSKLEESRRNFEFSPAGCVAPQVLDASQIQTFNKEGFLTGLRLFSSDEIEEIRHYFDLLLDKTLQTGASSYSISTAHLKHGKVYDLLNDDRLGKLMSDLIGPNVIGWGAHFFCKMPQDGKAVSWHQDASYWPLSDSKTHTVWLAIDDSDVENGCMEVIPGSHRNGLVHYHESAQEENNVLNQTIDQKPDWPDPVPICLKAGEISIHSDLLIHGSKPNNSNRRRCGLTLRYCPPEVRAGEGWNEKGVWVLGNDPQNHWANPARPAMD
jgi:non-heme Fe2+,alpha-ketoglutarate-dependent halogenase